MNKYLTSILLVLGFANSAKAQVTEPVLDDAKTIGRISAMEDMKGNLVFVPTLFSQNLSCNEKTLICQFKVFNSLTTDETTEVNALKSKGINILSIRPEIHTNLIQVGSEELTGKINEIQKGFVTLKNFNLSDFPYGNAIFKVTEDGLAQIKDLYETTGIGDFSANYVLKGSVRDFSIRIRKDDLLNLLGTMNPEAQMKFNDFKQLILSKIELFNIKGYESQDAALIVSYRLQDLIGKSTGKGIFKLDQSKIDSFTKSISSNQWVVAESKRTGIKRCQSKISVRKNAEMMQNCEILYDEK